MAPGSLIYVSNDSGSTWTTTASAYTWVRAGINSTGQYQLALAVEGLFISRDYGVTWSQIAMPPGFSVNGNAYFNSVSISQNGNKMLVNNYISQDYGYNWTQLNLPSNVFFSGLSPDGNTIFAGGLYTYISKDDGVNWTQASQQGSMCWGVFDSNINATKCLVWSCDIMSLYSADGVTFVTPNIISWEAAGGFFIETAKINNNGNKIAFAAYDTIHSTGGAGVYIGNITNNGDLTVLPWSLSALNYSIRGIDMSPDGNIITAVTPNNYIFNSNDGGATWANPPTNNNTIPWQYIAMNKIYNTPPPLTPTPTTTNTPTNTVTPSITPTISPTISPTVTRTSTQTPTNTPTCTPTQTATPTNLINRWFGTGWNNKGQLGLGDNTRRTIFTQLPGNWSTVVCGESHTMALSSGTNRLFGTGLNSAGQLGLGNFTDTNTFTILTGDWSQIACGYYHTFALSAGTNSWFGTGTNSNGELGGITLGDRNTFAQLPLSGNWSQIKGGFLFSMALSAGINRLFCTGFNSEGQLGTGDTTQRNTFTVLTGDWSNVVCGRSYTMALSAGTNKWFGTGRNTEGQLGLGNNNQRNTFTLVGDYSQIACGESHTIAISAGTNKLFATGYNLFGQLGLGDNTNRNIFTELTGNWSQIACGFNYTFALSAGTNKWFGTGNNGFGQLGLGDTTNRNTFTELPLSGNWFQLVCGNTTSIALSA